MSKSLEAALIWLAILAGFDFALDAVYAIFQMWVSWPRHW